MMDANCIALESHISAFVWSHKWLDCCRNISLSNLMYVKEDMILPHAVTFHELIKKRLRGKTGPLFEFGEHHDVRAFSDSRIQQNTDVHAGQQRQNLTSVVLLVLTPCQAWLLRKGELNSNLSRLVSSRLRESLAYPSAAVLQAES